MSETENTEKFDPCFRVVYEGFDDALFWDEPAYKTAGCAALGAFPLDSRKVRGVARFSTTTSRDPDFDAVYSGYRGNGTPVWKYRLELRKDPQIAAQLEFAALPTPI